MADVNLELICTQDLIDELFKRFRTFLFIGVLHTSKDGVPITRFIHQNVCESIGYLDYLKDELKAFAAKPDDEAEE